MIFREVLANSFQRLTQAGITNAARDARALVAAAAGLAPDRLTIVAQDPFPDIHLDRLDTMLADRIARKPVSRILGRRLFWGREFHINSHVLDPRGDTETLVSHVIDQPANRVLDMGTGSGILAVTLAAEWPAAQVVATDISPKALDIARQNAERFDVIDRVSFQISDWYADIGGAFDLIVSNPPYISEIEMDDLELEVSQYDPHLALTPGGDGLACYREIVGKAGDYLKPGGRLAVEIGWQQGGAVFELFQNAGFRDIDVIQDLDGKDRVVFGRSVAR